MDCSSPVSSVHEISQARLLDWIAISFARASSQCRDQTCVSCIWRQIFFFFNQKPPGKTPGNLWAPWVVSSLPEPPATFPGSRCGTPPRADHVSTRLTVDRVHAGLGQVPWPISGECIQERKVAGMFWPVCCPCCFCPPQTSLSSPCPCPFLS